MCRKALNIGSGRSVSIEEVIDLIGIIRGKKCTIRLPAIPVPVPVPSQRSDNTRMHALTGWQPEIPLADSLQDMYTAARKQTG
jgi:GDP-4-dehydro-6-deoxy-D-mannose reductase